MRGVVPERLLRDGRGVQPVPERLLRRWLHGLLVRCWWYVQRWDQRDGRVHLQQWVCASGRVRELVRHVPVPVLPVWVVVPELPERLQRVLERCDMQSVCEPAAAFCGRDVVLGVVPEWHVLERRGLPSLRQPLQYLHWEQLDLLELQQLFWFAVPVREHVRGNVPELDVRVVGQQLRCVQLELRHVCFVIGHVHVLLDRAVPGLVVVPALLPDRDLRERNGLHHVWLEPVWRQLHRLLLRHRRPVRPGHHRDGCLHVQQRVYAAHGWGGLQHLRVWVLPERLVLPGVPCWVLQLRRRVDLPGLLWHAAGAAWGRLVPRELRRWLLLGWHFVQGVRLDVCDVQRHWR